VINLKILAGIDLYYTSYANKLVPADYKLTEQDKQDGIHYPLLAMDSHISKISL